MSVIRWMKHLVPDLIKVPLHEARRRREFRQAFELHRERSPIIEPSPDLIAKLVTTWANEGFSALDEFIFALIRQARQTPGPILECGSGLSTLLLGLEAQRRGGKVWTLEHHPIWANRMRSELRTWGINSVEVCDAPLRRQGDFAWYDAPLKRMPTDFSLVVCDGPPGDTLGGRYGMLPIMRRHLRPGCVILLEDYQRPEEQAAAARWVEETGPSLEILGEDKPYALLRG